MAAVAARPGEGRYVPPTPTGLLLSEVARLDDGDMRALAVWHVGKAGDNDGRPWWPAAVRKLSVEERLRLASDVEADAAWERREQLLVASSAEYFVDGYGHVQDAEGGDPEPFSMWPEQREVLSDFEEFLRVWVLKARQLGLTWLALHYGFWLMAFNPATPRARVLVLSKTGDDASKLLARTRRINSLLPPYLRHTEDVKTRQAKTEFKLEGRGHMISLASTPAAARSETVTLMILDEAGFIRNGQAGETVAAASPTLGKRGKLFGISTGNGDAETPGDGQAFAERYQRAAAGEAEEGRSTKAIFLPSSIHPERDEAFYDSIRDDFDSHEDLLREYPETEDQALAGRGGEKVYSPAGITAAERLGREFDTLLRQGKMWPIADDSGDGDALHPFIDWGMGMTFVGLLWPLEGGGIYVPPDCCIASVHGEPGEITRELHGKALRFQKRFAGQMRWPRLYPPLGEARFDAAGAQSMRTFIETSKGPALQQLWRKDSLQGGHRVRSVGVPFGGDAGVGTGRGFKFETMGYLQRLFNRAAQGKRTQVIVISPEGEGNRTLLSQLRGLERKEDDPEKIKKVNDHGPDALIAGAAPIMVRYRMAGK
jgi:hypothetical protein